MIFSFVILRRARTDFRAIVKWLEKRSFSGAQSWRHAFEECVHEIVKDPYRFEKVAESTVLPEGVRQALFRTRRGNVYRIIFLIETPEVRILRIRTPGQRNLRPRDLR